jgi:hypothetical protein
MHLQGTAFAMQSTEQERAVAKLHAQAAQWEEYDDEYDDSFDDLADFGADASADTQGEFWEIWNLRFQSIRLVAAEKLCQVLAFRISCPVPRKQGRG